MYYWRQKKTTGIAHDSQSTLINMAVTTLGICIAVTVLSHGADDSVAAPLYMTRKFHLDRLLTQCDCICLRV